MKISITSAQQGLAAFIDGEFIPKIKKTHSAVASYGIAVAAALLIDNLGKTIDQLAENPLIAYLNIIDADRNIDAEKLLGAARSQMPSDGLRVAVPLVGTLVFTKEDVDALEGYLGLTKAEIKVEESE